MNLTDWFHGSTKPVRKGVYQRQYPHFAKTAAIQYCYWNGRGWGMGEYSIEQAMRHEDAFMVAPRQHLPWRGVLK
jgi:hypothetical protein